jgi:hypothetical protein
MDAAHDRRSPALAPATLFDILDVESHAGAEPLNPLVNSPDDLLHPVNV